MEQQRYEQISHFKNTSWTQCRFFLGLFSRTTLRENIQPVIQRRLQVLSQEIHGLLREPWGNVLGCVPLKAGHRRTCGEESQTFTRICNILVTRSGRLSLNWRWTTGEGLVKTEFTNVFFRQLAVLQHNFLNILIIYLTARKSITTWNYNQPNVELRQVKVQINSYKM